MLFPFFEREKDTINVTVVLLWWLIVLVRNRKPFPFSSKSTLLLKNPSETSFFLSKSIYSFFFLALPYVFMAKQQNEDAIFEMIRLERHWRYWFDYSLPHPSHEENHVILMSWWSYMCSNQSRSLRRTMHLWIKYFSLATVTLSRPARML